ncbi:ribonuclease III [Ammonifex degensii KC4]|uniref:Ribonuclease 3 n=1 Tax=Ammonifex degensii (strain DSM 10501 / KC4) TaxID=429009 RepID=C9RCW9_AMMDK|nr:ribonuclease III [Ammonifex degensii]ACX52096.1 ribonuclease III [Ammonifex degensii KC4]
MGLAKLKDKLGISWKEEKLLRLALTHPSYAYEHPGVEHNQRLEFLGDSVLSLVVSDYLYRTFPEKSEGELTRLRAAVVCEASLARVAEELGIGEALLLGRGEEKSGGRKRPSLLADAFEALLGAIYLDQGLEVASAFALHLLRPVLQDVLEGRVERDYKTELQELLQKGSPEKIVYEVLQEEGPDHAKRFLVGVYYQGKCLGRGEGRSKKEAEQRAAREAWLKLSGGEEGSDGTF